MLKKLDGTPSMEEKKRNNCEKETKRGGPRVAPGTDPAQRAEPAKPTRA